MRAGRLRHRIVIESPTEAVDDFGEPVKSWDPIPGGEVWAEKLDLSGRELYQAQQVSAEVTTQFTIRHRDGVDGRMSIRHDDVFYHIKGAPQDPTGRSEYLTILCARSMNEAGVDA